MRNEYFVATAWNNGRAGYGLKIRLSDRKRFFDRKWKTVTLSSNPSNGKLLADRVNVEKRSFWSNECGELISKDIRNWLRDQGLVPWTKGNPPKFRLTPTDSGTFDVARIEQP